MEYVLIIVVGVIIFIVVQTHIDNKEFKKQCEKENKRDNARLERWVEKQNKIIEENKAINQSLDEKYGKRTWAVPYSENGTEGNLRIYDDHRLIVLDHTKIIKYDDLKSCYVASDLDSKPVIPTPTQTVTKVDNASMLKRAAVGAVVAGPVGAIIGGATAKTKTEEVPTFHPRILGKYSVVVEFVNEEKPYIMSCSTDDSKARRIVKLIDSIIEKGYFDPDNH